MLLLLLFLLLLLLRLLLLFASIAVASNKRNETAPLHVPQVPPVPRAAERCG